MLLIVVAVFTQCDTEDPSMEASIETTMALQTNAAMQGKMTVEQAYLHVLQVDMVAKRTDGNQFTFSHSNEAEDKRINLTGSGSGTAELLFNIPAQQGKYDPIDISLTLQPDTYELIIVPASEATPENVDFADFLANGKPSIAFSGKFNNRGQSTRVLVALNIGDRVRTQATQLGKSPVGLAKQNRANFTIDPSTILQDLTTADLERAKSFLHLGERTILIHEQFNEDLYEKVIDRLFDDARSAVRVNVIAIETNG